VSWTEAEYEYARRQGKHIIALVHSAPHSLPRQAVDEHDSPVWAFRKRLDDELLIRNFQDDVELTAGLHQSLLYLRRSAPMTGASASPGGREALDEFLKTAFDRRYDLASAAWSHTVATDGESWHATLVGGRAMQAQWPEGVAVFGLSYTKATGGFRSFSPANPPELVLERFERSDAGEMIPQPEPRSLSPSNYRHDIRFIPAMREGEVCSFQYRISFPAYRFAYREDIQAATRMDPAGRRDYEMCSYDVSYPTRRLLLSTFIPDDARAAPLGFRVRKGRVAHDRNETARVEQGGFFSQAAVTSHGQTGIQLTLDVPEPTYKRTYDLLWRPPSRSATS
jgi:hypothetical protein